MSGWVCMSMTVSRGKKSEGEKVIKEGKKKASEEATFELNFLYNKIKLAPNEVAVIKQTIMVQPMLSDGRMAAFGLLVPEAE